MSETLAKAADAAEQELAAATTRARQAEENLRRVLADHAGLVRIGRPPREVLLARDLAQAALAALDRAEGARQAAYRAHAAATAEPLYGAVGAALVRHTPEEVAAIKTRWAAEATAPVLSVAEESAPATAKPD